MRPFQPELVKLLDNEIMPIFLKNPVYQKLREREYRVLNFKYWSKAGVSNSKTKKYYIVLG